MQMYTVGIVFDPTGRTVLIEKRRGPANVVGKWNGPGGKVELGESVEANVIRELHEETGLVLTNPRHMLMLTGYTGNDVFPSWEVYFYRFDVSIELLDTAHAMTDEPVMLCPINMLGSLPVVDNLRWIVPFMWNPTVVVPLTFYDQR